jgi:hypothetical protein
MYALAVVASLLVTLSLDYSPIVEGKAPPPGCATSDRANFTLFAVDSTGTPFTLGLVYDQNSTGVVHLAVSSLLLSATIVLIRHIFRRAQTM